VIGLERGEDFTRAITRVNRFLSARALRRYQRDIALGGGFALPSPFDGRAMVPVACHVANLGDAAHGNLGIAYRFDGGQPLWLLASGVSQGFPLAEVYLPAADQTIWSLDDKPVAQHLPWRAELRRLESDGFSGSFPVPVGEPTVLVGHPNFAHHLWNELPALQACVDQAADDGLSMPRVEALYEPLVQLAGLAPAGLLPVERVAAFPGVTGLRDSLVTRLGSTQVPAALRQRVVSLLAQAAEGNGRVGADLETLADCSPVFWLSVRVDARTAANQAEFLLSLVPAIAEAYPDSGFVFDGFSYPADFDHGIYRLGVPEPGSAADGGEGFLGGAMRAREREVAGAIDELIANLGGRCARPLVSVSGRDLAAAITLAGRADYYVCHAGTLQHKVAWLHNIPGIVHGNRSCLWPRAASWLAGQLEGGRPPALVSRESVEDLDSIRSPNRVERNRDYRFIDIPRTVGDILADIRKVLGAG
jgi:hypothetical protein